VSELGGLLAHARSERGETLRQVEEATGIPNAHISQIEKGHIETPSPNVLWALAAHYGLDFTKLMELAGHAAPAGQRKQRNRVAAFRAMDDLTTREQNEVLRYMAELRSRRDVRRRPKR
jgi:HTH-type transcriptional regulator, competence development regulator